MKILLRAFSYLKPYWLLEIPAFICALGVTTSNLVFPWIIKLLIDAVFVQKSAYYLALCTAALLVTALISSAFGVARQYLFTLIGEKAVADIRKDLFSHIQKLSLSFYAREKTGRLMSAFLNDVGAMQGLYTSTLVELVTNTLHMIVILVVLFRIEASLALPAVLTVPLFGLSIAVFGPPLRRSGSRVQEKQAEVSEGLQEAVSGIREVKSFTQERHQLRNLLSLFLSVVSARLHQATLGAVSGRVTDMVATCGITIIIWWGGLRVISGEMTPGTLIAFIQYMESLFGPTAWFVNLNVMLQSAIAGASRVFSLLDTEPEVRDKPNAVKLTAVKGDVQFHNVSFDYGDGKLVLKNVNLHARPGEMIALVGHSGAGKSTLVSLIPRFYDPTSGTVTVDGHDLKDVTQESLRQHIAVVFQDTFLFATTIRENIRFGRPDATDEEVEAAARAANAHEFIIQLPQGYDTQVGERGVNLSGGQRQRIAIARAILRNPRILILDEATSSLDSESEAAVQEALERLLQGRTCFVIAHRLSTVLKADKIAVLERGKIVEFGRHEELLASSGTYRRLYEAQFAQTISTEPTRRRD